MQLAAVALDQPADRDIAALGLYRPYDARGQPAEENVRHLVEQQEGIAARTVEHAPDVLRRDMALPGGELCLRRPGVGDEPVSVEWPTYHAQPVPRRPVGSADEARREGVLVMQRRAL